MSRQCPFTILFAGIVEGLDGANVPAVKVALLEKCAKPGFGERLL